jgi:hypothetical protein
MIPLDSIDFTLPTDLCRIMGQVKSDKGSEAVHLSNHNYTHYYSRLFAPLRDSKIRIFELGIGTNNLDIPSNMGPTGTPGASLYGWRQYFPKARIFGADIDRRILFSSERIQTFYCDQLDPQSIEALWRAPELNAPFDIIIEDGLHTVEANICFFENSIHKLKKGGIYVIEDVFKSSLPRFQEIYRGWSERFTHLKFEEISLPNKGEDNNLIIASYPTEVE